jgi:hypothetical protein
MTKNFIYAQNLCMLYVSCDLKPHMCFDFQNLSIYDLYMYCYWPYAKILWLLTFRGVFKLSGTAKAVWTRHVRTFVSDMSGYRTSGYLKAVCTPSNPKPTKYSPLLSCDSQGSPKAILDLLHRIPSVSRRFWSPTPCDLQTLVGFLSLKVYSMFLQDFFILRRSLIMHCFICLGVSLGYLCLALKSCVEWMSISCKLKTRFSYLNLVIYMLILNASSILWVCCF